MRHWNKYFGIGNLPLRKSFITCSFRITITKSLNKNYNSILFVRNLKRHFYTIIHNTLYTLYFIFFMILYCNVIKIQHTNLIVDQLVVKILVFYIIYLKTYESYSCATCFNKIYRFKTIENHQVCSFVNILQISVCLYFTGAVETGRKFLLTVTYWQIFGTTFTWSFSFVFTCRTDLESFSVTLWDILYVTTIHSPVQYFSM